MICWSGSATCVDLSWRICKMDVSRIYCILRSGRMKNICVWMICSMANVVCHGRIDGCNLCMWNLSIGSYSWGGGNYPSVVTWSSRYMSHDDLGCDVCKMWLWPGTTLPVPVFMVVPGTWPGMVAFVWSGLVVLCWGSWRRYPVWTIHYNVSILITFETPNVRAVLCYISLFLALKTVWHHIDCRWWSNCGSQLL